MFPFSFFFFFFLSFVFLSYFLFFDWELSSLSCAHGRWCALLFFLLHSPLSPFFFLFSSSPPFPYPSSSLFPSFSSLLLAASMAHTRGEGEGVGLGVVGFGRQPRQTASTLPFVSPTPLLFFSPFLFPLCSSSPISSSAAGHYGSRRHLLSTSKTAMDPASSSLIFYFLSPSSILETASSHSAFPTHCACSAQSLCDHQVTEEIEHVLSKIYVLTETYQSLSNVNLLQIA